MSDGDALSWTILLAMAGSCLVLGIAMGFGVDGSRAVLPVAGLALLCGGVVAGRRGGRPRVLAAAVALLQMTLFTILGVTLAYLLAARAGPLWDADLAAADARLGIDWRGVLLNADRMPKPLLVLGGVAYHSLAVQMVACILALAATGRIDRLRLMVAAALLSGLTTILFSGLMPAFGNLFAPDAYRQLWPSIAWLERDLVAGLRDGSLRQLDLSHLMGIVSFPSYHATLTIILAWSVRPIRGAFLPAALWAGLTVAATPLFGGHYVVDVIAGLLLALGAIAVARRLAAGGGGRKIVPSVAMRCTAKAGSRAGNGAGVVRGVV